MYQKNLIVKIFLLKIRSTSSTEITPTSTVLSSNKSQHIVDSESFSSVTHNKLQNEDIHFSASITKANKRNTIRTETGIKDESKVNDKI